MKRAVLLLVVVVAGVVFYLGYTHLQPPGAQAANGAAASSSMPGGAGQSGGQGTGRRQGHGPAVAVTVATAQKQTVPITDGAVGYVEAPSTAVIRARVDGVVVQQSVAEGQMVKTGDALFKLDDTAQQAQVAKDQAEVAKDQASLDEDQKDLERDQALVKTQAVTQQAVDQQQTLVDGASGTLQMDQAQLKADQLTLSYMTITAPIDGRVGQISTSVGNVVRAADTSAGGLLTITQMSALRVSFSIPERDLDEYRAALAKGAVPVNISADGDTSPRATAKLSFIDSSVDQSSGTVVAKADVDTGADKLWPGQYVNVVTQTGSYDNATTVPLVAVQQDDGGSYVFAVQADNTVKKTPIMVAATVGDIAVLTGNAVNPGDKVVTEGQLRLADGSAVTTGGGQGSATAEATTGQSASGSTSPAGEQASGQRRGQASSSPPAAAS